MFSPNKSNRVFGQPESCAEQIDIVAISVNTLTGLDKVAR
jgi:hypothetical protein